MSEVVPPAAAEPGADLLAAIAVSHGDRVGARVERLRDALALLVRSRYPDGDVRLVSLDQLVGTAAAAHSLEQFRRRARTIEVAA